MGTWQIAGAAAKAADLGRAGRDAGLPCPDGWWDGHGAQPGDLDAGGRYIVENEGVAPDIAVEETPKDVIARRDPQLERAIP